MDTEEDLSTIIKKYSGFAFLIISTITILYYIYKSFTQKESNKTESSVLKNESKKKSKQKMTIHFTSFYSKNKNSIDIIYQLLDKISDKFDIFLVIMVKDKEEQDEIIKNLNLIISDNIIYKHRILFCSSIDGVSSIVRSIDPIVHIEEENYVVTNLIRYINEFWLISGDIAKEKETIYTKIKSDSNNKSFNIDDLFSKIKFYKEYSEFI